MIRIVILADTLRRARSVAELLSDDPRLDIVEARAVGRDGRATVPDAVDVILIVAVPNAEMHNAGPPVIVLDASPMVALFRPPVRACLPLDSSPAEISATIEAAAHDLITLTPEQAARWLHPGARLEESPVPEPLTARELEVLRMLADGLANKEIGGRLEISEHTAKFHVAQILAKLGASSRAEAVAIGIRRGLVPV